MKRRSVTTGLTIWYSLFLVLVTTVLGLLLLRAQNAEERGNIERTMLEVIADTSEKIKFAGSDFIYDGSIRFFVKDVYVSLYDKTGYFLAGRRPGSVDSFPELSDKESQTVRDVHGAEWFVYDSVFLTEDAEIWIRGMLRHTGQERITAFLLRYFLFVLPGLLLLSVLGGWWISRKTLRPIRKIVRTVEEIRADKDLSRRIPTGRREDEFYALTCSINGMFDSLEEAFVRERRFSSDVSHELRTPLAVICSESEYALEDPDYREKALSVIRRQSRHMSSLVNKLLLLSRSDAGTLRFEKRKADLSGLLEQLSEQQEELEFELGIVFRAEIAPDIFVMGDEDMLLSVFLNLLSNAFRYGRRRESEENAAAPDSHVSLMLCAEAGMAVCAVSDDGPGIPECEQSKIWDRFYQVDPSRTADEKKEGSAGLGLPLVRALVREMNGTIELKSAEGAGAAFTVRLPLA